MALAVVAAALFVVGVACWLATSGRLRPRDSPPVVREGKPIVGNLLGFALGKRGPLDFIERNYHRYGGARPREGRDGPRGRGEARVNATRAPPRRRVAPAQARSRCRWVPNA